MSKIFGGSKSRSKSESRSRAYNRAYDDINRNIGSSAYGAYNAATAQLNRELSGGFEGYKANRDFDFMRMLGLERVGGGQSGRGMFNSGATLKRLSEYDNAIQNQYYQDYLNNLFNQSNIGRAGVQLIGGAGGVSEASGSSESRGKSSPGIGGFLGGLAGAISASDRRLKENVTKIGELENGLNLYSFTYIWDEDTTEFGVMADEVEKLKPEALGPEVLGYKTVDYGKVI